MGSDTKAPLHNGRWWRWCGCVGVMVTYCGDCGETVDVDYTRSARVVLTAPLWMVKLFVPDKLGDISNSTEWHNITQNSCNCSRQNHDACAKSLLNVCWKQLNCPCGWWSPWSKMKGMSLFSALTKTQLYRAHAIAPEEIAICEKSSLSVNCLMLQCPCG